MKITDLPLMARHFLSARWNWQHLRGPALERYQERRAQQIVAYALQHSPFYRNHWANHDPGSWRTLPTVDKRLMMAHFDTFTTRGIKRDVAMEVALRAEQSRDFAPLLNDLTVGLSSGTSGHRGLFLVSPAEQAGWAGTILARVLHGWRPHHLHVAFFLRSNSNLYEQVGGTFIQFRYFDLMFPLEEAVARLNAFQPHIVVGPPSLLSMLASERSKDKLRIMPERLISVAEVLEDHARQAIETIFSVRVQQIYQCTEGLLAVSCQRGALHIQEDIVMLQFEALEGSEDRLVQPIITDLWRKTQPIIRYRLNDLLELDPAPCVCGSGFRVIRAIEGRSDDICYFETLTGELRPFFPDTIRRMILLASPDITDYQVVQERNGQLHIYLQTEPGASFERVAQLVRASVAATIAQYACRSADVEIEPGLPPALPGKKLRRVRRLQ
ncbi:F390 synthetase-related protein [Ktedonosporobacter rubrisoli]|nr:F390 synthetase-related protein [Ktedonosporobacter rubrisoli]